MAKKQKTVYIVLLDDWDANSQSQVFGVTDNENWADAFVARYPEDQIPCLGQLRYDEFILNDPKLFPEGRPKKEVKKKNKI